MNNLFLYYTTHYPLLVALCRPRLEKGWGVDSVLNKVLRTHSVISCINCIQRKRSGVLRIQDLFLLNPFGAVGPKLTNNILI